MSELSLYVIGLNSSQYEKFKCLLELLMSIDNLSIALAR